MTPTVAVLDYGFGNVRSAVRAAEHVGAQAILSSDFDTCLNADGLIIPGVGAFAACMQGIGKVRGGSLVDARLVANRPVLGICVGMQIMFAQGIEHGISTERACAMARGGRSVSCPDRAAHGLEQCDTCGRINAVRRCRVRVVLFCAFLRGPGMGHERYRFLSASSACHLERVRDPFHRCGREWTVIGGAVPSGERVATRGSL